MPVRPFLTTVSSDSCQSLLKTNKWLITCATGLLGSKKLMSKYSEPNDNTWSLRWWHRHRWTLYTLSLVSRRMYHSSRKYRRVEGNNNSFCRRRTRLSKTRCETWGKNAWCVTYFTVHRNVFFLPNQKRKGFAIWWISKEWIIQKY